MAPGSLKAHVHPKCIERPVLQKKKKHFAQYRHATLLKSGSQSKHCILDKRIESFQNKNTSRQSRLGEHGPLNSGLAVVLENKSAYKKRLIFQKLVQSSPYLYLSFVRSKLYYTLLQKTSRTITYEPRHITTVKYFWGVTLADKVKGGSFNLATIYEL